MKNIIPEFIAQKSKNKEIEGTFLATALFLDISGFTTMTEQLMKNGKSGAETLSEIINTLFGTLIKRIYSKGGFISLFAGDAFTAIFSDEIEDSSWNALEAAIGVQRFIKEQGFFRTRQGNFSISLKIGLAFDSVKWGILGDERSQNFYFGGRAVEDSAMAEHQARQGDIVLGSSLLSHLKRPVKTKSLNEKYLLLLDKTIDYKQSSQKLQTNPLPPTYILERFMPRAVLQLEQSGEFRNIVSVFISLNIPEGPDRTTLHSFAHHVSERCQIMGAYCNNIDFGDKGCTMLVFFGAPVTHENDRLHAAHFSLELIEKFGARIRIGLCYGTVFAGFIGSSLRCTYTALGNVVNLSARLMTAAPWGNIWLLEDLADYLETRESFILQEGSRQHFKGIAQALKTYQLKGVRRRSFAVFNQVGFVGRTAEMQRISREFDCLHKEKKGGIVYFYGPAGSGKSRLLHEIYIKYKANSEFHFIHVDNVLQRGLRPFGNYIKDFLQLSEKKIDIEKDFAASQEQLYEQVLASLHPQKELILAELKQAFPFLGFLLGISELRPEQKEELSQEAYFQNTVSAIRVFFLAQALIRPTVLIIENIHAIVSDDNIRSVLESISFSTRYLPLLLLVSSRYTDEGQRPVLTGREGLSVRSETLDQLPEAAVEKLVASHLMGQPDSSLLQFIKEHTDSNAFFIEQFCLYLKSEELLTLEKGLLKYKKIVQDIPSGINALLLARIDRLSSVLREAAQIASVLGPYFNLKVFARVLRQKPTQLSSIIEEGVREQIWELHSQEEYKFKTTLLRPVLYEMQLRERLRGLHLKTAQTIQELFGSRQSYSADIAFHYKKAKENDLAREYYYKAAEHAAQNYNLSNALKYYDILLGLARHRKEEEALLEKKGDFLDLSGKWEEAIALLHSLCERAQSQGRNDKFSQYLAKTGELYQKKGNYPEAKIRLSNAIQLSDEIGDLKTCAIALRVLGRTFWSTGEYRRALETFQKGLAADEKNNDQKGIGLNLYYTGVVYRDQGDYEQALKFYHRSSDIFSSIGDRFHFTYPLYDLGTLYSYRGELKEAQSCFAQTEKIYTRMGYKSGSSAALLNLGNIEARKGKYKEALSYLEDSLGIAEEIGESMAVGYTFFSLGVLSYQQRDYNNTLKYFKESFTIMKLIQARGHYGYIFAYLACLFARAGRVNRAYRISLRHFKNIRALGSSDVENGRTHLGMALALQQTQKQDSASKRILKEVYALTGIEGEAMSYYKEAIARAQKSDYMNTLIPALYEYGLYLHANGKRKEAKKAIQEAQEFSQKSSMLSELEHINRVKKQIGLAG